VKLISKGRLGSIFAGSMLLLLAVQPAAAAVTKFGANLPSNGTDVSNAYQGQWCDHEIDGGSDTYGCTWILMQAFNGGTVTAPKNGTINKVRIMNGKGGSFKVVVATKNSSGQFKVTARSAKVYYSEDPNQCDYPTYCTRRAFSITPLTIKAGQYLGIQTAKTSTLRCDSGGNKIALLTPPLAPGGSFASVDDYSGCFLMVQAVYQ